MCFCAGASFGVGGTLVLLGLVFICILLFFQSKPMKEKWAYVPLSIVPLLFGIQQICEGFVWENVNNETAIRIFTFFAFAFWPFWIPFSFATIEASYVMKKQLKKRLAMKPKPRLIWLLFNVAIGLAMTILITVKMYTKPMHASIRNNHILYGGDIHAIYATNPSSWTLGDCLVISVYIYLIISSMLLSSARGTVLLAVTTAITLIVAVVVFNETWTSIWCFFEAIVSLIILYIIYMETK